MAPPRDLADTVQRLHAAITALDPDVVPPLPPEPTDEDVSVLLGILTAHTDNFLHARPTDTIPTVAAAYNQVLGNRRDGVPTPLIYDRFAARLRMTGVSLMTVTARGPAMMMTGCLMAAYEGAQLGSVLTQNLEQRDGDLDRPYSLEEREAINKHLTAAQEHMQTARQAIVKMAGYPDGEPDPEKAGTVLVSDDPRITKIVDLGVQAHVEYTFDTPDGPRHLAGRIPLEDVAELVGVEPEERYRLLVEWVEATVDRVQAGDFQQPPPT